MYPSVVGGELDGGGDEWSFDRWQKLYVSLRNLI